MIQPLYNWIGIDIYRYLAGAILTLSCCASCGGQFGESTVRVVDAKTGRPLADVLVYADYALKPQPTLFARLLAGMDHRSYTPKCVATRLTSTASNGAYELTPLTEPQKKYSKECAKKHYRIYGEFTKKEMYIKYYKTGMERVPCKNDKKWTKHNVVCMSKRLSTATPGRPYGRPSLGLDEARLYNLQMFSGVTCFGDQAILLSAEIYKEAKSLDVNYQDMREIYPGSDDGPTVGDYLKLSLEGIENQVYHPEKTRYRKSIFKQIE